jgi:integrase
MTWSRHKARLDRRLGFERPWTLHDLRRSVATRMADIGVEPHVIEATLNHHSGFRSGVAGTYNRSAYTPQIAAALARWSAHVAVLVENRTSNVVALQSRV